MALRGKGYRSKKVDPTRSVGELQREYMVELDVVRVGGGPAELDIDDIVGLEHPVVIVDLYPRCPGIEYYPVRFSLITEGVDGVVVDHRMGGIGSLSLARCRRGDIVVVGDPKNDGFSIGRDQS